MQTTTEGRGFHRRRYLEAAGERVSSLHLFDHRAYLGRTVVRVAGVGGVTTEHAHRNKGYARSLMDDTHAMLFEEGYDVAVLFGIPGFYEKFGYATCVGEVKTTVATRDIEAAGRGGAFRARPFAPEDFPAVQELFTQKNAGRGMCLLRPHGWSGRWRHGSAFRTDALVTVLEGPGGEFAGYAVCDALPEPLVVAEAEVRAAEARAALMKVLAQKAIERREGQVAFQLPADHELVDALRPLGCNIERAYPTSGGVMARIINQDALLARVVSGTSEAAADGTRDALAADISTELTCSSLMPHARTGNKAEIAMPASVLLQLLTGFRTPGEIAAARDVSIEGPGLDVLKALAPCREPQMYGPDRF